MRPWPELILLLPGSEATARLVNLGEWTWVVRSEVEPGATSRQPEALKPYLQGRIAAISPQRATPAPTGTSWSGAIRRVWSWNLPGSQRGSSMLRAGCSNLSSAGIRPSLWRR